VTLAASAPDTVLGYVIIVGLWVVGAGALLGRGLGGAERPA
jgi:hypothetical protein